MAGPGKDLVLGYDFGTSAVKAAAVDRSGRLIASASASYPLMLPQTGWAEQNPAEWWRAFAEVTEHLLKTAGADASRVAAIAPSAQMCGVVPVDRQGEALRNCLIWLDTRSSDIAQGLMSGPVKISGYGAVNLMRWLRLTGGAPNLSGKDPPSKMLWLSRHEPAIWARTHKLLDVADYLVHRLTGNFVTSFDRAHLTWLFDARAGKKQWSEALLKRVGIARALLPDVLPATGLAGSLRPEAAKELGLNPGTPITAGLGDLAAAALAAGALSPGAPHLNIGTSSWLGAHVTRSRVNPLTGIGSLCGADGGDYLLIATQEHAGVCVKWALPALGFAPEDFAGFEAAANSFKPRADAPMFFPWLSGERVPVDDKTLRGGFVNLSLDDGRPAMARAVYEGVTLNMRWAMDDFDRLSGAKGKPLRLLGGGAGSALWCQIFADVLGRPLELVDGYERAGARGSAMTAAVLAKWYPNLAAASESVKTIRTFTPDASLAPLYAGRFAQFTAGHRRLQPLYHRLHKASEGTR